MFLYNASRTGATQQLLEEEEQGVSLLVGDGGEGVVRVHAAQVLHQASVPAVWAKLVHLTHTEC